MPEVKYEGQIEGEKSQFSKIFNDVKCPKCGKANAIKLKVGFGHGILADYEPCRYCGEEFTFSKYNQMINDNVAKD